MGYRLNRLDKPVFKAVPKPMQTEFGIHHRFVSCVDLYFKYAIQTLQNATTLLRHNDNQIKLTDSESHAF